MGRSKPKRKGGIREVKIHPPQLRLPPRYLRPGIEIQRMCRVSQYTVLSGSAGNCQGIQTDLWAPTHLHPSFALKKLGQADGVEMSQRWCPICPSHRHRLHPPVPAPPLCDRRRIPQRLTMPFIVTQTFLINPTSPAHFQLLGGGLKWERRRLQQHEASTQCLSFLSKAHNARKVLEANSLQAKCS